MKENPWRERAALLLFLSLVLLLGFLAFSYVRGPLTVGFFSFLGATAVQAPAKRLSARWGISQKVCAAGLILLLFLLLAVLIGFGAVRLWQELRDALRWLSENFSYLTEEAERRLGFLLSRQEGVALSADVTEWILYALEKMGAWLGARLGALIRATPRVAMLLCVGGVSSFYLAVDYERIGSALLHSLPEGVRARALLWRERTISSVLSYGRACLLLMLLTFLEAFVGLWILGQPMGLLLAFLIAVADVLPLIGAGTVLIPWGLFSLAGGRILFGVGLLVLYGVIAVVRQLTEPRLLGGSLGLHPLVTLWSMLLGFWFFGGFGMVAGPFVAVMARGLLFENGQNERK